MLASASAAEATDEKRKRDIKQAARVFMDKL